MLQEIQIPKQEYYAKHFKVWTHFQGVKAIAC